MKTNREIAEYTLEALRKAGADHAQCIVSHGNVDELNADSGEFSLMRTLFNSSVSMKVLKDGKKGTTSVNKTDKETIDNAVKDCIAAAESSVADRAESIAELEKNEHFVVGVVEPDRDKLFDRLQEYLQDVSKEYPKVVIEQLISSFTRASTLLMNTNGVVYEYDYGGYDLSSMFSASEGEKSSSFVGYGGDFENLDNKLIDFGMMRILLEESEKQLDTKPVEGKFVGKIVITPACLDSILMVIFRNFISDTMLINGTSMWKDSLGKKVASDKLSVSTVPLDKRVVCGERFTAEGYRSENMDIIKDGVLKNFMLSQYGANKTGFTRAKNLSYNFAVQPGDESHDEIIRSIDRGILLNRFSGGMPSVNGDFSGVAKNSFLIENGKVTAPISETMISGNLADMLNNVIAVSADTVCDGVSILPWIAFDGITISGK
ncbi:MAG: TldD/PmbA family protein [Eubacteriales bacterium]|jgi:PmbA protein